MLAKYALVREVLLPFLAANDISKITAAQAYDRLFGDHIDFATFHAVWQDVLAHQTSETQAGDGTARQAPLEVKLEAPDSGSPSAVAP